MLTENGCDSPPSLRAEGEAIQAVWAMDLLRRYAPRNDEFLRVSLRKWARRNGIRGAGFAYGPNSVYILVAADRNLAMKLSGRIKPLSYLKARAPEVIRGLAESREPMIITVNGEAKAVIQDIASFEENQETLALLKLLALANKDVEAGKIRPVDEAFAALRQRVKT